MTDPKYLLWLDLETTGTDENKDQILELAYVITTYIPSSGVYGRPAFDKSEGEFQLALTPAGRDRIIANEVVLNMHRANGLLDICTWQSQLNTGDVQEDIIAVLNRLPKFEPHSVMLAGSGVSHFDRRCLKAQMSQLEKLLAYGNLDVGVVRRYLAALGIVPPGWPKPTETHRAMPDVRTAIAQSEAFNQFLMRASDAMWNRATKGTNSP